MAHLTYGTPEFYAEGFSDYLADIDHDNPAVTENLLKGFLLAIEDWLSYHSKQADEYTQLHKRVRESLGM